MLSKSSMHLSLSLSLPIFGSFFPLLFLSFLFWGMGVWCSRKAFDECRSEMGMWSYEHILIMDETKKFICYSSVMQMRVLC